MQRDPEYDTLNTVERHKAYFECAYQVGQHFAKPGQKIVYYLISDSSTLKKNAAELYGEAVVMSSLTVAHVDIASQSHLKPQIGMLNGIAEMWTFASTDFQIITLSSGFGKLGAWAVSFGTDEPLTNSRRGKCSELDQIQTQFSHSHLSAVEWRHQCRSATWQLESKL